MDYTIHNGDCLEVMRAMGESSVDAIVTDPPYGLSFMGKGWDHAVPGVEFWAEALRVAKPGAHLLAFGGTRLYHRLTCAIEDAGWEVRDCLMWLYGSGFPKSHDVSKAIDKAAGAEREVVGRKSAGMGSGKSFGMLQSEGENATAVREVDITAPATDAAKRWQGWGTALKPAYEPIILARKPLAGTVAANVTEWGTGAVNVDECKIHVPDEDPRWPANLILEEGTIDAEWTRYFYQPKASKRDRDEGLEDLPLPGRCVRGDGGAQHTKGVQLARNYHPTVKPTDLMRYLCRLVTPPGGTILDPFTGSGSTGKAAALEGFDFIGCELDATYCDTARRRIEHARTEAGLYASTA